MSETGPEFVPSAERAEKEPTIEELAVVCSEVLSEEEIAEIRAFQDFGDALGYAFTALIEAGEDPDTFLTEKGIITNE